jgi:flagellar biosynthetic protein FlhB
MANNPDKQLPASERRKSKARADGQVPRSRDLGHFAAMAMGGAALMVASGPLAAWMQRLLTAGLRFDHDTATLPPRMGERFWALGFDASFVILPMGLLMAATGVAATVLGGGWNLSFKSLQPDLTRCNPISGLGRLFAKHNFVEVLKMSALTIVLGSTGYFYLKGQFATLVSLMAVPLPGAILQLGSTVSAGLGLLLLILGGWALIDVPLQRYFWLERLKMSREEVKQEHKDAEGNAEMKSKIKAKMRQMSRRQIMAIVPLADLVVMNPTHYAVALRYDEKRMGAPRVVAKGADLMAMKIRDVARAAKVPVLQAPPLARALYTHVELDGEVPAALFAAVAQVLAWVYQLRARPNADMAPPEVEVPGELDPNNPLSQALGASSSAGRRPGPLRGALGAAE